MSNTGESLIPYQEMMERALRGLVREALVLAGAEGLPGNHHYYISFRTQDDGVVMPAHLRARYPDEMTIVVQHQYWGLETDETGFSITLSFGGRSERLTIPFEALTAFMDPAVNFGLQFRAIGSAEDAEGPKPVAVVDGETAEGPDSPAPDTGAPNTGAQDTGAQDTGAQDTGAQDTGAKGGDDDDKPRSGTVVTLDTFRKK